jgi:hypothetical protein
MSRSIVAIKRFDPRTGEVKVERPSGMLERFLVAKNNDDPSPVKMQKIESPEKVDPPKPSSLFGNSNPPAGSLFGNPAPAFGVTSTFGSKPIANAPPLGQKTEEPPASKPLFGQPASGGLFGNN